MYLKKCVREYISNTSHPTFYLYLLVHIVNSTDAIIS